jgi:6-phosphogluconolactonase
MTMVLRIFSGKGELSHNAVNFFIEAAREAIEQRNQFSVALSGGSAPLRLYELLGSSLYRDQVLWDKVHVFWADERWVLHDDIRNNAKTAFDLFLKHVPIPPQQINRMSGELGPLDSAMQYEYILQEFFAGKQPQFDLILLGLGEDGHTASLFPGSEVLKEQKHWVKAFYHSEQKLYRITLTAHFINYARKIIFLVMGKEKSAIVAKVLEGKNSPKLPAELIVTVNGELIYFLDEEASSKMKT